MSSPEAAFSARFAIDLVGMKKDLNEAVKLSKQTAAQVRKEVRSASGEAARHAGGGGGHGGGASGNRALGDTLDALTGERGWVMRMTLLQHSLPIAGVAALALGFEKVVESIGDVQKATKAARAEIDKPISTQIFSEAEAQKGIKALDDQIAKLRETRTVWSRIGSIFGSDVIVRSLTAENDAWAKKRDIATKFNFLLEEEIGARGEAMHSSTRELDLLNARYEAQKKIADIQANADPSVRDSLTHDVQSRLALEEEVINRKADAGERERALERDLIAVRDIGDNVAVESAKKRVEAAQKEFDLAQTDEAGESARNKVDAAKQALREVERQSAELKHQQSIAIEIANFRGSAEARQYDQLRLEGEELQRQTINATADEKAKLAVLIAQNAEKRRQADFAASEKGFELATTLIDATTGRGEVEQYRNLAAKLATERNHLIALQANPDADPAAQAKSRASINQLNKQLEEMREKRAETNREAHAETTELELQLGHMDEMASALRSYLEFKEKINKAQKDGNAELARELTKQQQLTLQLQAQNAAKQHGDKSKATLGELAAHALNNDGRLAREATRVEERANRERERGHFKNAEDLQKRADGIKQRIPGLKQSEKDDAAAFIKGMDATQMAKDIKKMADSQGKAI